MRALCTDRAVTAVVPVVVQAEWQCCTVAVAAAVAELMEMADMAVAVAANNWRGRPGAHLVHLVVELHVRCDPAAGVEICTVACAARPLVD